VPKRRIVKTTRWTLLLTAMVLLFGLGWLFWIDIRAGRDVRETDRVQSAQERIQDTAPAAVPAAPATTP